MDIKEIISIIPKWLIIILIFIFLIIFIERLYISKEPFLLFDKTFGPALKSKEKIEIYDYFMEKITKLENVINILRIDKLELRNRLLNYEHDTPKIVGKVLSIDKVSLSGVKIVVEEGGSQTFSNLNGEFLIYCQIGQRIEIEKEGYESRSIVVDQSYFNRYTEIILYMR